MASHNLAHLGVLELSRAFESRTSSPVSALAHCLENIRERNPGLGIFLDLDIEGAFASAEASQARWAKYAPLSPLDGVPIGIKANIAVAGLPWHAGIGAYRDRIAARDAEVVAKLRAAGAVILGSLNMHEGALGATTDNPWFGRTHNPLRRGFTAGGSSGGSAAAVAAFFCAAALGTDTMGSVRIPSAYCGVFGHKPARDAVPRDGLIPLSPTLDTIGVHARSAEDCEAVLRVIARNDLRVEWGALAGMRLALLDHAGRVETTPDIDLMFERAAMLALRSGFATEWRRLPSYDFGRMRRLGLMVVESEGAEVHRSMLDTHPEGFSQAFRDMLAWGARQPTDKLSEARLALREAAASVEEALAPFDALLAPTTPQATFPFDEGAPANQADFTALANFLDWPACVFPCGHAVNDMPLSVQVVARNDEIALAIAGALAAIAAGEQPD